VSKPITHALTVLQPWAGLIAAGLKTVEFRSRPCPGMVGKRVAIRSGGGSGINDHYMLAPKQRHFAKVRSAIVAVATIAECRLSDWRWDRKQPGYGPPDEGGPCYAWVLSDVVALKEPLPWQPKRGAQVWAKLPPEVAREVERRLLKSEEAQRV